MKKNVPNMVLEGGRRKGDQWFLRPETQDLGRSDRKLLEDTPRPSRGRTVCPL